MRPTLIVALGILFALTAAGASACWTYSRAPTVASTEVVQFDSEKRDRLIQLRSEQKYEPHVYPPLGYTGIATPEEGIVARAAVNDVLDAVLSRTAGPISATEVTALIRRAMKRVDTLETEDRERTAEYMIEVWYLLGFRGATGQFAYGSAFQPPTGYGEPLPPGWKSPSEPRPLGGQ